MGEEVKKRCDFVRKKKEGQILWGGVKSEW